MHKVRLSVEIPLGLRAEMDKVLEYGDRKRVLLHLISRFLEAHDATNPAERALLYKGLYRLVPTETIDEPRYTERAFLDHERREEEERCRSQQEKAQGKEKF